MRQPTGDNTLAGYVRQSSADIIPTATVRAAPINAEYNKLRDAFAVSSGHKHDGSTGEGGYIPLIGDVDALNKVVIDTSNNRVGVFVEVSSAAVEQVRFQDGVIVPVTTNDIDLGSSSAKFKDLHLQGTATIATVDINAGNIDGTILGASSPTTATFTSATLNNNLTVTGTSTLVGTTTITSVDLNSGAIDNAVIGSATPVAGTFTTLNANTSLVAATADINGGTLDGATVGASVPSTGAFTTLTASGTSTLTTVDINGGNIDGTVIGASATAAGSFTTLSTSGQATLATADINGGSIDGSTIGASSASTGAFTTLTSSGGITGNVTGNLTGNVTGNVTGDVTGNVTGNLTGNVTAGSGTSTFTNLVVNGNLNMNAGTSATITNLTAPSADLDAATKKYVDDEISGLIGDAGAGLDTLGELADALNDDDDFSTTVTNSIATKLPKAGGTMTGAIAMSTNKITGVGNPTSAQDVSTKAYTDAQRDTRVAKTGDTMSGALAMGNNKITGLGTPTANTDATTKTYVDGILGSATVAATSATNAATSETNAATSATAASNSATSAATSATNAAASYDNFDDRYLGAKSSAPTLDNDGDALITGALYFNTTSNIMFVRSSSGWQAAGSAVNGTSERTTYTATAGQTVFAATYDTGYIDVYLNGVKLLVGTDFTATNGTSITLASGASVNDVVDIVAYGTFVLADHYTKTASDARYVNVAGDTMTGNLSFGDNDKAIFGAGSDLQIYHDGANNYIEGSTGSVIIQNTLDNYNVIIKSDNGSGGLADYFRANGNTGAALMYHYGSEKLTTTSTGIDVTGTVTADGLIINNGVVKGERGTASAPAYSFGDDADTGMFNIANANLGFSVGGTERMRIDSSGKLFLNSSSVTAGYTGADLVVGGKTSPLIKLQSTTGPSAWDIYTSSGASLIFARNQSDKVVIDSSGNIGIGTSSPSAPIDVVTNSNVYAAEFTQSNTSNGDGVQIVVGSTASSDYALTVRSDGGNTSGLAVKANGKVGIGTFLPENTLHILDTSATSQMLVQGNTNDASIKFNKSGQSFVVGIDATDDSFRIADNSTLGTNDRLVIDSSGNVLVGKTATGIATVGAELKATGELLATVNNDACAFLNRKSSDGSIINFRKDGTTVGSIGNKSNDVIIYSTATNHSGIRLGEGYIFPVDNTGNTSDGVHDLGLSVGRYKDAYLSGGIYLGGTGSANKLDDYEEGTWTPQLSSDVSITSYTILNGYYTKVGRLVTVSATVQAASLGSWSGASIALYGLPFTVSNASNNEAVGTLAMRGTTGNKDGLYIRFIQNGTYMRLEHRTGYTTHDPNMPANTIDTGTKIYVTGSYFVA